MKLRTIDELALLKAVVDLDPLLENVPWWRDEISPLVDRLDQDDYPDRRSSKRWAVLRRMVLRRADGVAYLDRIRLIQTPWFAIYVHRFDAPDPGIDLHDHPWSFLTMVVKGGYTERRADTRRPDQWWREDRRPFIPRIMRLGECHTIEAVAPGSRSIVITGRRCRKWGFYVPAGWIRHEDYNGLNRRELTYQEDS